MGNSNVIFSELYSFDLYNHLLTAVKQKSPGTSIIRYHGHLLQHKVSKIELMHLMPLVPMGHLCLFLTCFSKPTEFSLRGLYHSAV